MSGLIRLYPRAWRERYGDELEALVAERPPTLRDRVDIVRGAVDARLFPQLPGPDLLPDRSGLLPLAGALSFAIGIALAVNGPVHYDEYGSYRDGGAALPFVIVAMVTLAVGIYRLSAHLPAGRDVPRLTGALAIICGVFWSIAPWVLSALAIFLVAILVLTASASRAGVWPTAISTVLVVLTVPPLATLVVMLTQPWYAMRGSDLVLYLVILSLLGILIVFGIGLLRGFPPVAAAADADPRA
jgi:hypothetical protein